MTSLGEVQQNAVLSADSKDLPVKDLSKSEWSLHKGLLLRTDISDSRKKDYLNKVSINATYQGSTLLHVLCDPGEVPREMNAMFLANNLMVGTNQNDPKILQNVRFLLDNGANPNLMDRKGHTALFIAAKFDQTAIVKLLLKQKYKTDVNLGENYSPLHGAAGRSCISTVNVLLEHKAEVDRTNPVTKETPLYTAVGAKFLALKSAKNDVHEVNRLEANYTEVIKRLLAEKANPNQQTIEKYSPFFQYLHYCSENYTKNRQKIIQLFLFAGASIDQMNGGDSADLEAAVKTRPVSTPLSRAITRGNFPLMQDLLKAGKTHQNINHFVIIENSPVLMDVPVINPDKDSKASEEVPKKNESGSVDGSTRTPKHSVKRKKSSVQINIRTVDSDKDSKTSEAIFDKRGYPVSDDFTQKYFISTVLNVTIAVAEDKFIVPLLEAKADLKVTDEFGLTALHVACILRRYDMVVLLVKKLNQQKITLDTPCKNGNTALYDASAKGDHQIVRFLLQYKGKDKLDINAKCNRNETALHVAAYRGHSEVIRSLIINGADIDAISDSFYTPLVLAVIKGHANVVEQLIDCGANMFIYANAALMSPLYVSLRCQQYEITEIILGYYRNLFSKEWVQCFEKLFDLFLLYFDRVKCSSPVLDSTKKYYFSEDGSELERIRLLEQDLLKIILQFRNAIEIERALAKLNAEQVKEKLITSQELQEVRKKYNKKIKISDIKEEEPTKISAPNITFLNGKYSQHLFVTVARAPNHFFCLAEKNLVEQRCSVNNLMIFAGVRPKFCSQYGESGLKKLTYNTPIEIWVNIEGELRKVAITCELKTLASDVAEQRVLCFEIPSDQGKGCLIIGAIFAEHLDTKNDLTKWHMSWTQEKPLVINLLPQLSKKETVQALCSMGLLSSFNPVNLKSTDKAIVDTIMDYYSSPELPNHRM